MEEECWKIIPFEDNYSVSDKGRIINNNSGNIKSLRKDKYGYVRVTLYPSGKTYSIHRLVGLVWLKDSYQEDLQIDHLDADRTNNQVVNLEWVTQKENVLRIKQRSCKKGINNKAATITEEQAYLIKYSFDKSIKDLITITGISREVIEGVRRRETWKHIVDETLEYEYLEGLIKYKKGVTANLTLSEGESLNEEILLGISTKVLCEKYGISKSAVCSRRRKILSVVE